MTEVKRKPGLRAGIWGPYAWACKHVVCVFASPEAIGAQEMKPITRWVRGFQTCMVCKTCRLGFGNILKAMPIEAITAELTATTSRGEIARRRRTLSDWFCADHNAVNAKLEKERPEKKRPAWKEKVCWDTYAAIQKADPLWGQKQLVIYLYFVLAHVAYIPTDEESSSVEEKETNAEYQAAAREFVAATVEILPKGDLRRLLEAEFVAEGARADWQDSRQLILLLDGIEEAVFGKSSLGERVRMVTDAIVS